MASHEINDLYRQVEEYSWDHDMEFQGGLTAILGSPTSREQAQELTLRARCFYYTRWLVVLACQVGILFAHT